MRVAGFVLRVTGCGVRGAGLSIWDMGLRILDWIDGGQRLLNLELGMRKSE